MTPQTPTKHVCHQKQKKPETTALPPPPPSPQSKTHLPTPSPSPSPLSHTRKQQHQVRHHHDHHVRFNLTAVSSCVQISSDPGRSSQSRPSDLPTSPAAIIRTSLSGKADFLCPLTPPTSDGTPSPTRQGPPCSNCHKPSTLCTVGPFNPKGNAGKKYFACRRCPYGLAWVGWAEEPLADVVFGRNEDGGLATKRSLGDADGVDGGLSYGNKQAGPSEQASLISFDRGNRRAVPSPGRQGAKAGPTRCCCGKVMKLDYVDVSWDASFCSPSEDSKKWFWTCARGSCNDFLWVEDSGCVAPHGSPGAGDEKGMGPSVRILW